MTNELVKEAARGITNLAQANSALHKTLDEIQTEAQSSPPVGGMCVDELRFYQAMARRISLLATRALDRREDKSRDSKC